jgi:hypothetical protein
VLVPTYDKRLLWIERTQLTPPQWQERELPYPEAIGRGKSPATLCDYRKASGG